MICSKCGSTLREGDKFCPYCGTLASASGGKREKSAGGGTDDLKRKSHSGKEGRKGSRQRSAAAHGGKEPEGPNGQKAAIFAALAAVILLAVAGAFFLPDSLKKEGNGQAAQADETAVQAMNNASGAKETAQMENTSRPEGTTQPEDTVTCPVQPENADAPEGSRPAAGTDGGAQPEEGPQTEGEQAADHETQPPAAENASAGQEETVKGMTVPGVPKASYYYSFNDKTLGGARAVFRVGNSKEGYNSGTLPQIDDKLIESYTDGVDGKALFLNGSYGVVLDDIAPVGNHYTIGFWVRPDRYENFTPMLEIVSNFLNENNDSRWIVLNKKTNENGAEVFPVVWSCDAATDTWLEFHPAMPDGTSSLTRRNWYYIALSVNGDMKGQTEGSVTAVLYVNGQRVGSGDVAAETFVQDGTKVYLGINCWDVLFQGAFDEIKVWNSALSDAQISGLYEAYGFGG